MQTSRNIQTIPVTWDGNQSQPIMVSDFRNVDLTVVGTGDLSVLASKDARLKETIIDFTAPSTIDNSYAQVVILDETVVASPFVTALTVAGSTKIGEVDTNALSYICLVRSAGTVDALVTYTDNN